MLISLLQFFLDAFLPFLKHHQGELHLQTVIHCLRLLFLIPSQALCQLLVLVARPPALLTSLQLPFVPSLVRRT